MGLLQATSIAVGTMIGASIFSIFGLGARIAGHNLPLVFVISGLVALLVAWSYARLGSRIISNAGPIEFILQGSGDGILTGALSILFWLSYVVSLALFAKGFAGYFLPLVHIDTTAFSTAATELGVMIAFVALNLRGARRVGSAEFAIVLVKLAILALFVAGGLWSVHLGWIEPTLQPPYGRGTIYAIAIFFLSYMGFGLVTNASEDIRDAGRNVPRAIYLSIAVVSLVYILVSVVAVGNLPLAELVRAEDFALAEAARPFLGETGYLLVSLGALFSIASAINATLYGGANVAWALARDGELPELFERKVWFRAPEGLYITAGLSIAFALLFNLNGIASITAAVLIVIYLFVLRAHLKLLGRVGGNRLLIRFALLVVGLVFLTLLFYQWHSNRVAFWSTWGVFAASLLIETVYRLLSQREFVIRDLDSLLPHLFHRRERRP
ncbi:MAG TPA: amino acid permease [Gammaproteobacteria bacterium]|nr:amino acid permease [Gammaproteobacteria bacterium]